MKYSKICEAYEALEGTSKGLEKTSILASFLEEIKNEPEIIYLLQGKVFADYDERELGLSQQLVIKALSKASGLSSEKVVDGFRKLGDLGKVAEKVMDGKKQTALFSSKLTTEK